MFWCLESVLNLICPFVWSKALIHSKSQNHAGTGCLLDCSIPLRRQHYEQDEAAVSVLILCENNILILLFRYLDIEKRYRYMQSIRHS